MRKFGRGEFAIWVADIATDVAWHRNGVGGLGFYVVRFKAHVDAEDARKPFVGTITEDAVEQVTYGDIPVTVLRIDLLAQGNIGAENRWRGDGFYPALRAAVKAFNRAREINAGGGQ